MQKKSIKLQEPEAVQLGKKSSPNSKYNNHILDTYKATVLRANSYLTKSSCSPHILSIGMFWKFHAWNIIPFPHQTAKLLLMGRVFGPQEGGEEEVHIWSLTRQELTFYVPREMSR